MPFKITLIDNAVDEINALRCDLELYLDIAKDDDIPESEQYYAIKRCIKQLICSWELLLKYCLQHFDWKQIFADPKKASIAKLQSGNFCSVKFHEAIGRLAEHHVSMPFDNLNKLHRFRNQIEHHQIDMSLQEVISVLLSAIDELEEFYTRFVCDVAEDERVLSRGSMMFYELTETKESLLKLLEEEFFHD